MADTDIVVDVADVVDDKIKEPGKYKVLVYNDDVTTVEFVMEMLVTVFKHNETSAFDLTVKIHNEGKAVAGIYRHEVAEQKVLDATNMSRAHDFPLVIRMLPE